MRETVALTLPRSPSTVHSIERRGTRAARALVDRAERDHLLDRGAPGDRGGAADLPALLVDGHRARSTFGETPGARPCLANIRSIPAHSMSRPTSRRAGPPAACSASSALRPLNSASLLKFTRRPRPSSKGEYCCSGETAWRALVYSASIRIRPASTRATSIAVIPTG